jgi:very-short-patch-repair endonuclease
VYALGRADLQVEGRWMAAVLACGDGDLLSHRSAAALHGVLPSASSTIDVTIPRPAALSRPGIRVHRSAYVSGADQSAVRGVPCTSVPRTLLDLATVVNRTLLERACDQAEIQRLVDWSTVHHQLTTARGRRGVRRLRAVLGTGERGNGAPRSDLEQKFLALCRRAALPSPAVNQWLAVSGEEMQVDFVWHGPRVVVETDGFRTHGTRRAFREDRRRDRLLGLEGWRVVRFTWDDLTNDPEHVMRVVRDLVRPALSSR